MPNAYSAIQTHDITSSNKDTSLEAPSSPAHLPKRTAPQRNARMLFLGSFFQSPFFPPEDNASLPPVRQRHPMNANWKCSRGAPHQRRRDPLRGPLPRAEYVLPSSLFLAPTTRVSTPITSGARYILGGESLVGR